MKREEHLAKLAEANNQNQPAQRIVNQAAVSFSAYQGATPSPELLREFEAVVPGAAKRFLDNYFENSKTARKNSEKALTAEVDDRLEFRKQTGIGQKYAFWLGCGALAVAIYMASKGASAEGAALVGAVAGLSLLVTAFTMRYNAIQAKLAAESARDPANQKSKEPQEKGPGLRAETVTPPQIDEPVPPKLTESQASA